MNNYRQNQFGNQYQGGILNNQSGGYSVSNFGSQQNRTQSGINGQSAGYMTSNFGRSQYQGFNPNETTLNQQQFGPNRGIVQYRGGYTDPANQYGYTSQYRGFYSDHSEEHGNPNTSGTTQFAGSSQYTGTQLTGTRSQYRGGYTDPANAYGYTSQYRGFDPNHSEEHGGYNNLGTTQFIGTDPQLTGTTRSQYRGGYTDPANAYGYTSQYRGFDPNHSEEHGGFNNLGTGQFVGTIPQYTTGARTSYQGNIEPANQYGYTSQYRGFDPNHSEEHGGYTNLGTGQFIGATNAPYQGNIEPANQYGYTSQYRGFDPNHSEEHGGYNNFGGGYNQYPGNLNRGFQDPNRTYGGSF